MGEKIRVLIVDDHALFRSGVKSLLQRHQEFEVVDVAGDGLEGVKRAKFLEATSRRRHMAWEIGIVVLGALLGPNRQLDVSALYALPEEIVVAFDDGLTLGGVLSQPLTFNDPVTDGIGPIPVMTSIYLGFALTVYCPIVSTREAKP